MKRELILNNDGTLTARVEDDSQAIVDLAEAQRNDAPMAGARYKKVFTHAAYLTPALVEKMKNEDGVNFFAKEDRQKVLQLLYTKYPKFLTIPGNPFGVKGEKIYSRPVKNGR